MWSISTFASCGGTSQHVVCPEPRPYCHFGAYRARHEARRWLCGHHLVTGVRSLGSALRSTAFTWRVDHTILLEWRSWRSILKWHPYYPQCCGYLGGWRGGPWWRHTSRQGAHEATTHLRRNGRGTSAVWTDGQFRQRKNRGRHHTTWKREPAGEETHLQHHEELTPTGYSYAGQSEATTRAQIQASWWMGNIWCKDEAWDTTSSSSSTTTIQDIPGQGVCESEYRHTYTYDSIDSNGSHHAALQCWYLEYPYPVRTTNVARRPHEAIPRCTAQAFHPQADPSHDGRPGPDPYPTVPPNGHTTFAPTTLVWRSHQTWLRTTMGGPGYGGPMAWPRFGGLTMDLFADQRIHSATRPGRGHPCVAYTHGDKTRQMDRPSQESSYAWLATVEHPCQSCRLPPSRTEPSTGSRSTSATSDSGVQGCGTPLFYLLPGLSHISCVGCPLIQ